MSATLVSPAALLESSRRDNYHYERSFYGRFWDFRRGRIVEVGMIRRFHLWPAALVLSLVALVACSTSGTQTSPSGGSFGTAGHETAKTAGLPPRVLSRSVILRRYGPARPGIAIQAKLVKLASLAKADPSLTQCEFRGCTAGQYVWLILEQGPPGSFDHSRPSSVTVSPQADAWLLFPVDAVTGASRGDDEIGDPGQVSQSAWGKLGDPDA
jgi:hypothetical protein